MQLDTSIQTFRSVAASVVIRLYRMRASDAALFRMIATFAEYTNPCVRQESCTCSASQILKENFAKIDPSTVAVLDEEYSKSTIVTAFSLVDGFLTDVLRLLLLKHPGSIPKERQMKVGEILEHSSFDGLVREIIEKYVREAGYLSIEDRIAFLQTRFGIKNLPDAPLVERLTQHSELRNSLIHDQSLFSYRSVGAKIITEPRKDLQKVDWERAEQIVDDCILVIETIYSGVTEQVYGKRLALREARKQE